MRLLISALIIGLSISSAQAFSIVDHVLKTDPSLPLPNCDAPRVANTIMRRFNSAESKYPAHGLKIAQLSGPDETRTDLRDDEFGDIPLVPMRLCAATATMSNGATYRMNYSIEAKSGFAGVLWGVEFCVDGLDASFAYNGDCRPLK